MKANYYIEYLPTGSTYLGDMKRFDIPGGFDEAVSAAKAADTTNRVYITFCVLSNARHYVQNGELHDL